MPPTYSIKLCILIACLFTSRQGYSQPVIITDDANYTTGSSSSVLDIKSTSKGLLIPRLTSAQRSSIANLSDGLLVYQTDGIAGFYYYNGSSWDALAPSSGSSNISTVGTVTSGDWQASTIGVTKGGTGLTSVNTGDILYASASNTLSNLPGNTSTTKKVLTQTGTGSAGAAPVWDVLDASDIPDLSGIYAPAAGSSSITTIGNATSGSVPGALKDIIALTSSGTYTPSTGTKSVVLFMVGGGGGGGGVSGVSSRCGVGSGGGAGGLLITRITNLSGSYSYVIGNAGNGGGSSGGADGGSTTFTNGAVVYTAFGGGGGNGQTASNTVTAVSAGDGAIESTNGIMNSGGDPGTLGWRNSGTVGYSGSGGRGRYGAGGAGRTVAGAGNGATGHGAGGGGAMSTTSTSYTGGNGTPGLILVYEYW